MKGSLFITAIVINPIQVPLISDMELTEKRFQL